MLDSEVIWKRTEALASMTPLVQTLQPAEQLQQ